MIDEESLNTCKSWSDNEVIDLLAARDLFHEYGVTAETLMVWSRWRAALEAWQDAIENDAPEAQRDSLKRELLDTVRAVIEAGHGADGMKR
jgi:hypothetical protein